MKNIRITHSIATLILCLWGATINAQAPKKFSYQAVVRNSSNSLVSSASVGIQISILQGSENGALVYTETHTATTNTNGLVSLQVGNGSVLFGNFDNIDWGAGPYFIKTETDPEGGTNYSITGTTELLSVPYALYAENSLPGPQGIAGPEGPAGPIGPPGVDGAGLNNKGNWSSGNSYSPNDYVFASSSLDPEIISMWIVETQSTFVSNIPPADDEVNWVEFQAPAGPQGPQGLQGPEGIQGETGPQGISGLNGLPGETGSQGIQGEVGPPGPAGPQGIPGVNGLPGEAGPQGIQGEVGPQGATGPQGIQGPQGLQGPAGIGLNNMGSWVSGSTYEPNDYVFAPSSDNPLVNSMWIVQSPASFISNITPSADATNWIEFQAPAGPQGDQGIQGEPGIAGPVGPQGPIGPTGATGAQGPAGPIGLTGATGPQGEQGLQGIQGLPGAVGAQGPAGPQGPIGLTGATGAQGPAGPIGPTGATGPQGEQGLQGIQGLPGAVGAQGPAGPQGPQGETGPAGALLSGEIVGFVHRYDVYGERQFINLDNVTVSIEGTSYSTATDANGRFSFSDVPTGTYTFICTKSGDGIEKLQGVPHVGGDTPTYLPTMRISPVAVFYPISLNATSSAVNGVTVTGTLNATDIYSRRIALFIGFTNSTSNITTTYIDFEGATVNANGVNFSYNIPKRALNNMGATAGTTIYIRAYGINGAYSSSCNAVDYANGKRDYTCVSSQSVLTSVAVQ